MTNQNRGMPQQSQFGQPPFGQAYAGPQYGQPMRQRKMRPIGPILLLLAVAACAIGVFLPWQPSSDGFFGHADDWNGFDQMMVNIDNGRVYGALMMVSFIVAGVSALCLVVAAFGALATGGTQRWPGVIAIIFAILGLIATAGMLVGYVSLGATDFIGIGTWIYGLSGVVMLLGAIGVASRAY